MEPEAPAGTATPSARPSPEAARPKSSHDTSRKRPASEIELPAAQEPLQENEIPAGMTGIDAQQPSEAPAPKTTGAGMALAAAVAHQAVPQGPGNGGEGPARKRRGRPPGSKNKPKPASFVAGRPSVNNPMQQALTPAPVFRPTPEPGSTSVAAPIQILAGIPLSSAHQQLLAAGINLPLGSASGIPVGKPVPEPTLPPLQAPAQNGNLQHQAAMPEGVQGPASIPQAPAIPQAASVPQAAAAVPAGPGSSGPKKRGRPPGSKNRPKPSPLAPAAAPDASMAAALPEAQAAAAAAAPQPPTAPAANPVATHGDTDQMMREVTGQDQPIPMGMPGADGNPKKRGRPPGSKNRPKTPGAQSPTGVPANTPYPSPMPTAKRRGRPRKDGSKTPGAAPSPMAPLAPSPMDAAPAHPSAAAAGDAQQHAQATSIYPQLPSSAGVGSLPAQSPADDGASPGSDKKPRGRPKGSKNRVKPPPVSSGAVLSGGTVMGIPIGQFPPDAPFRSQAMPHASQPAAAPSPAGAAPVPHAPDTAAPQ